MRIYRHTPRNQLPPNTVALLSRRRFIKNTGLYIAFSAIPLGACKNVMRKQKSSPVKYVLTQEEKYTLAAVQQHLLPDEGEGPGAKQINAESYFEFVLTDKYLDIWERNILINGLKWVDETAKELFKKKFVFLKSADKERVLRDLETFKNGRRWLSFVLGYIFEALLGSTAYGVNTGEIGWKWLSHIPGYPQPTKNQIYGTYGYGL